MPIRKRRPTKHLNKNDERLKRRDAQEYVMRSAGSLQTRFPTVSHLDIQMDFVSVQGHVLNSERRTFQPDSTLKFTADCPGRCGNGTMDMESVVNQMITSRQTSRSTNGFCRQTLYPGSSETCNCELRCKITAEYFPAPVEG
jgi:hypothetical protein